MTKPRQSLNVIEAADMFCGAGGTTNGLKDAAKSLGLSVRLIAVNHWNVAIATHSKNHPDVEHRCQGVGTVNPLEVVPSGRLTLLVASPECTHHSNARGGKPRSDQKRADAWELFNWLTELYVENVLIENVREFRDWGPLGANGKPLKKGKGLYYRQFRAWLEVTYKVEERILNAADYGDATTRERLFLICRRPKHKKIVWPVPTHASPRIIEEASQQPRLFGPKRSRLKPWRSAREIIDWTLPSHSIFLTREDVRGMRLNIRRPLSPNTLARIFAGLEKYSGFSFILPHQHGSSGNGNVRDVDSPLPTVTGTSSDMFLAQPFIVGTGGPVGQQGARNVEEPLQTVVGQNHRGVVQPFVPNIRGGEDNYTRGVAVDEPLPTVTGITPFALVNPFVMNMQHSTGEGGGGHGRYCYPVERPLTTIAGKGMYGLIEPFLLQYFGEADGQGVRVRTVDAPLWTVTGQRTPGLVEGYIVKSYTGSDACSVDDPLPTVTANREHFALAQPFITKYHGSHKGRSDGNGRSHSVGEPLPTADGSNRFGLALPFVMPVNHGGGDLRTRSIEEPLPTLTRFDALGLAEATPYILKFNGTENGHAGASKESSGVAVPQVALVIPGLGIMLDIRFRMLQWHELAGAMSFPRAYSFAGTRDEKVQQIGNAVPRRLAKALCRAILTADRPAAQPRRKAA